MFESFVCIMLVILAMMQTASIFLTILALGGVITLTKKEVQNEGPFSRN